MAVTSPSSGLWGRKLYCEHIHPVCKQAATDGEALVLLLDDTQMTDNAFLADINSFIMTGAASRQKPCGCMDQGCSLCQKGTWMGQKVTWMGNCQILLEAEQVLQIGYTLYITLYSNAGMSDTLLQWCCR